MNRLPWGRLIVLGVCAALLVALATAGAGFMLRRLSAPRTPGL
jgi:hypothetical protein